MIKTFSTKITIIFFRIYKNIVTTFANTFRGWFMCFHVVRKRSKKFQIFYRIILFISINVMNYFRMIKHTSNFFFHNKTMNSNGSSFRNCYPKITKMFMCFIYSFGFRFIPIVFFKNLSYPSSCYLIRNSNFCKSFSICSFFLNVNFFLFGQKNKSFNRRFSHG